MPAPGDDRRRGLRPDGHQRIAGSRLIADLNITEPGEEDSVVDKLFGMGGSYPARLARWMTAFGTGLIFVIVGIVSLCS